MMALERWRMSIRDSTTYVSWQEIYILCPLWRGWPDMVAPGVVVKNLVMTLDLDQPGVFSMRLKDIHVQLMNDVHGPKYIFSKFMDLTDINYKFIDLKMHFKNLWTYVSKVY